jgi:phosphomannomutase
MRALKPRLWSSPLELYGGGLLKKLVVFDLDGTLAESKSPLDFEMASLLRELLGIVRVAVISGGDWPQFEKQLLFNLTHDELLVNLFLLPTCGTKFFKYTGQWKKLYSEDFTAGEKARIVSSLDKAAAAAGFKGERTWGEITEDRGSQITFSALGQRAPLAEKKAWDPDFTKRKKIKAILDTFLPDLSVLIGGATSIDVTRPGIDKAYGIQKLRDLLGISITEMIFIGDALFVGGNDYPVEAASVVCIAVRNPAETKLVIRAILACFGTGQSREFGKREVVAEVADRASKRIAASSVHLLG